MKIRPADVALVVVLGAVQLVGTHFAAQRHAGATPLDPLAYALLVAGPLALLGRRWSPPWTLAAVFAITFCYAVRGYPEGPVWLSLIVAFVRVVVAGYRRLAWATIAVGYLGVLWVPALSGRAGMPSLGGALGLAAWLLFLIAAAEVVRARAERAAAARSAREADARRAAGEERMRIARELHDVLAHNISLINVQAGVALHLLDEQPERGRAALEAIKQESKEALRELRSVLGVLRRADDGEAPRSPTPGLAGLDDLTTRAASAGVRIRTEVAGEPRELPAGVDLAAYRIVQEALTNVTRHAGAATATVRVVYGERELTVTVDDDGRGPGRSQPAAAPGGNGITGMRERAESVGGRLSAGARDDGGGFRVRARLPLDGAS